MSAFEKSYSQLPQPKLTTLATWQTLDPYTQGFTLYLEQTQPGSELKDVHNPHRKHSVEWEQFNRGAYRAMMLETKGEGGE